MTYPKGGIWPTRPAAPPPGRGQRPAPTAEERRADWHAQRRQCLTASMVAPVLGVPGPGGTALDVWAYLTRGVSALDSEAMDTGRRLEPVIVDWLADTLRRRIEPWPQDRLAGGAPDIWGATPDAVADDGAPVEVKAWAWGGGWANGPPRSVWCQVQVQAYTLGALHGYVGALLGGRFGRWIVPRDDTWIRRARRACRLWWERHIVQGRIPTVDGSDRTARLLGLIFEPRPQAEAARLPAEADAWIATLRTLRLAAAGARRYCGQYANALRAALGPNAYGVTPLGTVVSHRGGQLRLPTKLPAGVRPPSKWRGSL